MGKLWGSQRRFDENGDGQLGTWEWQEWYADAYGHDIELAERRENAQAKEAQEAWLQEAFQVTYGAAEAFLQAAEVLLPLEGRELETLAWQAFLCQITDALTEGSQWEVRQRTSAGVFVNARVWYPYRRLAFELAEQSGLCGGKEVERAVGSRLPLFTEVGTLTAEQCGTFWRQVIEGLPPYGGTEAPSFREGAVTFPDASGASVAVQIALEELMESLLLVADWFAGAMGTAGERRGEKLLGHFADHWRALRGVEVKFRDETAEQLVELAPQLRECWTAERLGGMDGVELLYQLYDQDPAQAIAAWRGLAGTEQPLRDPAQAQDFFDQMELVWRDGERDLTWLRPMVEALREESFARQVFQSAFVSSIHLQLIRAIQAWGGEELTERALELLDQNRLPWKRWTEPCDELKQLLSAWLKEQRKCRRAGAKARRTAPLTEESHGGDALFHYCTVRFPDRGRTYSYLTGGLPLKTGSWVEVPFGREDLPRLGQVCDLVTCTRREAPWPPEKTKTVLRVQEEMENGSV